MTGVYVDPQTVHDPVTGTVAPAAWGDVVRNNLEFLIDPPGCSAFNNAAVSLTNNTLTVLNANSENYDTDTMHSPALNPSRIVATTAGRYLVVIKVNFAASGTGERLVGLLKNGVSVDDIQLAPANSGNTGMIYTATIVLAAADYIEARARQTSGGALNVTLVEFAALFMTR